MDFIYKDNYKHFKNKKIQQKGINSSYLMLCATLSFSLIILYASMHGFIILS